MKALWLLLLATPLALCGGCGGDDGGGGPPPPPTDEAVLAAGWDAFEAGDLAAADVQFRELLVRGALLAEAHDGLGWRFVFGSAPDSALVHFTAARAAGADASEVADEVFAGLAFAHDALGHPGDVLTTSAEVDAGWDFAHDTALDHADLILLRAVAQYALGDFAASLVEVQRLAPAFDADVDTPAGRAALAAKIEELQS
jgi:hypothetical protein